MVSRLQNAFWPSRIFYNYIAICGFTFDKNKARNILVLIIVICVIIIFTVINILAPNCDISKYNMADAEETNALPDSPNSVVNENEVTSPSPLLTTDNEKVNINLICEYLKRCSSEENVLNMDYYLLAYHELYRFFLSLGSVFGFVASDVIQKITILEDYRKSENAEHYSSLQSMIHFEKNNNLLRRKDQPSGSRTLLRLHRALEFITVFLRRLSEADEDAKTSSVAQESYENTLAKFHPWLIKKGAILAMYTLPSRQNFIQKVIGSVPEDALEQMNKMANSCEVVYNMTQELYYNNDLLDLP